ncbi:MAG: hypothetical protein V3V96_15320 [Acidiferrobacterales bacterium]
MYEFVPTIQEHASYLAEHMRQEDVDECWAACRYTPEQAVKVSVDGTPNPITILRDGEVVGIYGVGKQTLLGGLGIPWMLRTDLPVGHTRKFYRSMRKMVDDMNTRADYLLNYVDVRNRTSVSWLSRVGFTLHDPVPYGPDELLFHPFTWEKE